MTEQFAIDTAQNAFMIALQIGDHLSKQYDVKD